MMNTGAEIPFRRSRFSRGTGSLLFDRQRDMRQREAERHEEPMRIWSKGHFVEG
ncbi:hypothetical protein [Novosphingobium guangzhouense]|uniref:hypothetical protein n=1 Tax=Novosphingobium guangzhouense TaxID=1850347 RepID=UPI00147631B6|nr:hypothetical protein [Novosphingobium guangzhouense]